MGGWRQAVELAMTDEEIGSLARIARSRTETASRVERAQMLLSYRENPSFFAVGQRVGVHHQTVERCVERALAYEGPCVVDVWVERTEDVEPAFERAVASESPAVVTLRVDPEAISPRWTSTAVATPTARALRPSAAWCAAWTWCGRSTRARPRASG
mgnify:CR=1 FL=1